MDRSLPGDKEGKLFQVEGTLSMHVHGLARNWSQSGSGGTESSGLAVKGLCVVPGHWFLSCRKWGFNRGV